MVRLLAPLSIFACLISIDANALGLGAAEANSYIGEPLSVRVPLFNVADPNSLSINLKSRQFDGAGSAKVTATLDRSNSQLSVILSSDSVVNEPYVSFTLDLVDNNIEFSKQFNVLMDLRAGGIKVIPANSSNAINSLSESFDSRSNATTAGAVMGPYDTAQTGRIAKQFGAVLDGQSLWRVARRINRAMGVSRSQMMWGLYKANPDAFSSRSISSLKAGSFLIIPDQSIVKNLSDSQAKARIAEIELDQPYDLKADASRLLKNSNNATQQFDSGSSLAGQNDSESINNEMSNANGGVAASPFQVTGIDTAAQDAGAADPLQAQNIIASLTETVGNLSQQMSRKDQKIEFLEKQIVDLKGYIGEEASAEQVALTAIQQASANDAENMSAIVSNRNAGPVVEYTIAVWQWLLLCLFALSCLAYLTRDRLYALGQSLNLFGSNDQVEFNTVPLQDIDESYIDVDSDAELTTADESSKKDYSVMHAVEKSAIEKDVLEGVSYMDLADDGSFDANDILQFDTKEKAEDIEDLSFDQRFEQLLAEGDFEFARELLDFARHNEINDERYHCERLRLFEKMRDEDGFYKYYYEIESKIPKFRQSLQTQISQLVVKLAHH
ncbi:MAG: FimV-like protein [Arenicella sp.]|jgi:FimV-like protein